MAVKSQDVRFCSNDYHHMTPMACTFDALKSDFMDNFFELKHPSGMVWGGIAHSIRVVLINLAIISQFWKNEIVC